MRALLIAVALAACSNPTPTETRGDAAEQFASAYCEARQQCGIREQFDHCRRHIEHHLCELEGRCDEQFQSEHLDACLDRLYSVRIEDDQFNACRILEYAYVPAACIPFWEELNE